MDDEYDGARWLSTRQRARGRRDDGRRTREGGALPDVRYARMRGGNAGRRAGRISGLREDSIDPAGAEVFPAIGRGPPTRFIRGTWIAAESGDQGDVRTHAPVTAGRVGGK